MDRAGRAPLTGARRIALLLLALGLLFVGAASVPALAAGGAQHGESPVPLSRQGQESSDASRALADKYAPIVYLREQKEPCDKAGEAYRPSPVEIVLGNPNIVLKQDTGEGVVDVTSAPEAGDLYGKDDTYFLDFPGSPQRPGCGYEQAFREIEADYPPVAYAHIVQQPGRDGIALQYWFFFYFNDWNNKHEGDWEMVQLTFDGSSPSEALQQDPSGVAYAQHGGGETASWDSDKLQREGDRIVVYTAAGSHASEYSQQNFLGRGEEGTGFGCDNASSPSRRVDLEARVIPDDVDASSPYAWIVYEGRWGEKVHGELNGPTGPNTKGQWSQPFTWQDGLRDSSVAIPESEVGPNSVVWFCRTVRAVSTVLFGVGLWAVVGLVVAGFISVGVTVRRTQFRPALAYPLRRTRRYGQILSGSFAVYRHRPWLFLGIGVIFVPMGFLTALLQSYLASATPVGPLFSLFDGTPLEGALALAIGALQFGITYWLVLAAAVAAIREQAAGRDPSVGSAYRIVLAHLRPLVGSRLRAVAIIALLSVSIVGIPIAVYLGVRWTFLEQVVLIEGDGARASRGASGRVVDGHWWRTLGVGYSIVAVGIALGPILGMLLVLVSSLALGMVNVISSVFYVALIPFVGIALTMLYFDLHERTAAHKAQTSDT